MYFIQYMYKFITYPNYCHYFSSNINLMKQKDPRLCQDYENPHINPAQAPASRLFFSPLDTLIPTLTGPLE